jgi:hypothetical protein
LLLGRILVKMGSGRVGEWAREQRKQVHAEQKDVGEDKRECVWRPRADYGFGLGGFTVDVEMMAGESFERVFA